MLEITVRILLHDGYFLGCLMSYQPPFLLVPQLAITQPLVIGLLTTSELVLLVRCCSTFSSSPRTR